VSRDRTFAIISSPTVVSDKHEDEISEVLFNIIAWRYFLVCLVGVAVYTCVTTRYEYTHLHRPNANSHHSDCPVNNRPFWGPVGSLG
jgi:hypothetical protein